VNKSYFAFDWAHKAGFFKKLSHVSFTIEIKKEFSFIEHEILKSADETHVVEDVQTINTNNVARKKSVEWQNKGKDDGKIISHSNHMSNVKSGCTPRLII